MKTWKIGLCLICVILICIWYFLPSTEGFDLTTYNVSYTFNELFLVAPNINTLSNYVNQYQDGYDISTNIASSLYSGAYTFSDAKSMCAKFGATMATPAQMQRAMQLGAKWCVASWASDGNLYAPCQKTCPNTIRNTTAVDSDGKLRKFAQTATTKAYPTCWGVKPPNPTVNVREFNNTNYSMISDALLASVMLGAPGDLFPMQFTVDQANFALQQPSINYNIGAQKGANPARDYLIANIDSVNEQIYRTDSTYAEDGSNAGLQPCTILANTRAKFQAQFKALRQVFSDVSGAVIAMLGAKNENAFFSAKLQGICSQESISTSPACAKLATLDFDLLYSTQGSDISTSRLAALEALNYFHFQRQQELCIDYNNIRTVESYLGCNNSEGSMPECTYQNMGLNQGSSWVLNNLDVNSEEFLKIRLQEISPYFSSSDYNKLLSGIINQLSLTLRIPSLNDFNDSNQNFKVMHNLIDSIRSYMRYSH